jgi:CRISPR system Cascade subunit CasA
MPTDSRSSFLLTDQPWIPVLDPAGRTRTVSLRELFAECAEMRGLACELPTQSFAILRLLLAVLHRAVGGPADERAWRALWTAPRLPMPDIDDYLTEFRDRFDLLHPTTPFYQVADLRTANNEVFRLARIIADVPSGAAYLTCRLGPGVARIPHAEAARWLVHGHAYDVAGIKSGAVGDPRVSGGKVFPQGTGLCGAVGGVFLEGRTLRETLLLNLVPLDSPYLRRDERRDVPVWERPPLGSGEEDDASRGPHGPVSLYTWQSRRIRFVGDGEAITGVLLCYGDKLSWEDRHQVDPMTGWRRSAAREKELKRQPVYLPATHDPARALWRGLDALLPPMVGTGAADGPARLAPGLAQWLSRLRNAGHVDAGFRVTMTAVGVVYGTQQSIVDDIYHDSLTMTVRAFDAAEGLRSTIVDSAADADAAVKALRTLAANLCRAAGGSGSGSDGPPGAAGDRAASLGFAALDQRFRRWLAALDATSDPVEARTVWQRTVREVVASLGDELVAAAGPSAWAGREIDKDRYVSSAQADLWFRRALRQALPLAAPDRAADHTHDTEEALT